MRASREKKGLRAEHDLGADFEHAPDGFVDYVLLNTDGRPVAVVEAKKESIDPLTGEIGKTIFFAVSRKHATKLVTLLNEEATRRWPQAYAAGSTFAVQVTSDIEGAQQMTIDYAHNNLNGNPQRTGAGRCAHRWFFKKAATSSCVPQR